MIEFGEHLRIADPRAGRLEMIERSAEVPCQIGRFGGVQQSASLQLCLCGQARRQLKRARRRAVRVRRLRTGRRLAERNSRVLVRPGRGPTEMPRFPVRIPSLGKRVRERAMRCPAFGELRVIDDSRTDERVAEHNPGRGECDESGRLSRVEHRCVRPELAARPRERLHVRLGLERSQKQHAPTSEGEAVDAMNERFLGARPIVQQALGVLFPRGQRARKLEQRQRVPSCNLEHALDDARHEHAVGARFEQVSHRAGIESLKAELLGANSRERLAVGREQEGGAGTPAASDHERDRLDRGLV